MTAMYTDCGKTTLYTDCGRTALCYILTPHLLAFCLVCSVEELKDLGGGGIVASREGTPQGSQDAPHNLLGTPKKKKKLILVRAIQSIESRSTNCSAYPHYLHQPP